MLETAKRNGDFSTTNWSVVLEAGRTDTGRAAIALERLCAKYWHPIYVFIRRRGSSHHEAEDLAQSFFSFLLEKETVKSADAKKGKFRSFLLASLNHFLLNEWDKRRTLKRGGHLEIVPLDEAAAEKRYHMDSVEQFSPEKLFDRRWALTLNDSVPMPKVIDFGIAKAAHGKLTDQTLFTAFEQFIGTPAYMSPEQAEMSALDIDTRSDIYSLGVLLYELLTGRPPFDAKELVQAGLDEIRRTIREKEPARPSARLSTLQGADLTLVAKHRQIEPPKLVHLVRGDLDWIVMKTLEKDRTRRYESASGLAADLLRHLNNEPVTASPPSTFYRLQKMVRRHKLAVGVAAGLVVLLAVGIMASTWQAVRATRAERAETEAHRQSEIARQQAEAETLIARQAQIQSEQRLAESLSAQGDALASVGQWDKARWRYRQSEWWSQKLGLSAYPPQFQTMSAAGGNFQFSWNSVNTYPAVGYQVQYTTNLISGLWVNLGGVQSTTSFTTGTGTDARRFYRVLLVQ